MNKSRFERLVAEALDSLPLEFQEQMENVDVVIEAWPSREQVRRMGLPPGETLLGLYEGVPLTEGPGLAKDSFRVLGYDHDPPTQRELDMGIVTASAGRGLGYRRRKAGRRRKRR